MSNVVEFAFPLISPTDQFEPSWGLTKREHYAALAMQGLLSIADFGAAHTAQRAVEMADALLAELARTGPKSGGGQ